MKTLLHVSASPRHAASHSRKAAAAAIAELQDHRPALQVIERDLGLEPLPHPDAAFVQASLLPDAQRDAAQRAVLRLSDRLIAELSSADAIVLSTPMHNFTLPSVLKAWIDHVVRP
ncbi:Flavodoxin, partial [mine drainage metagenome]